MALFTNIIAGSQLQDRRPEVERLTREDQVELQPHHGHDDELRPIEMPSIVRDNIGPRKPCVHSHHGILAEARAEWHWHQVGATTQAAAVFMMFSYRGAGNIVLVDKIAVATAQAALEDAQRLKAVDKMDEFGVLMRSA